MTEIDINNGILYLNGQFFQPKIEIEGTNFHVIDRNSYSNSTMNGEINEMPFKATAYYKNNILRSISLNLDSEYLKEKYREPTEIDFKDYLSSYVEFWKKLTEKIIGELIKSKKRNFNWGKVQIQIDPRNPTVYCEIKYNNIK